MPSAEGWEAAKFAVVLFTDYEEAANAGKPGDIKLIMPMSAGLYEDTPALVAYCEQRLPKIIRREIESVRGVLEKGADLEGVAAVPSPAPAVDSEGLKVVGGGRGRFRPSFSRRWSSR